MLTVDSREQKWEHVEDYFIRHGIEYQVKKLDTGDYRLDGSRIVVDRKRNLGEALTNLCSKDDSRFWREVRRSSQEGIKLVFLVEHGPHIKSIKDVCSWKSKYSTVSGRVLADKMFSTILAYGVEWEFCCKQQTGAKIWEILNRNSKESERKTK